MAIGLQCAGRESAIELTVAALARRMPRWSSARRSMLLEVRQGLDDAAEAYVDAGWDQQAAEARAVADFGDIDRVAADYATLRVARSGLAAAVVLGPGYVLVLTVWLIGMVWRSDAMHTGGHSLLADSFTWLGLVAVTTAALGVLGLRFGARRGRSPRPWTLLVGGGGVVCAVTTVAISYVISPWTLRLTTGGFSLRHGIELFSGVVVSLMLLVAVRALVAALASVPAAEPVRSRTLARSR